jgi:hypothetical protein
VAEQREAGVGELHANLVRAAGVELHVHEGRPREALQALEHQAGAARGDQAGGEPDAVARVTAVGGVESAARGRRAVHEGGIALLDEAGLERRLQGHQRRLVLRDHQYAAGVLVEAVDDPWSNLAADGREVRTAVQERVDECPGDQRAGRVHHHPGRLVDDDDVVVLVEDVQRKGLGDGAGRARRPRRQVEQVALVQLARGFGAGAVDEHGALLDQPLQLRAGDLGL